MHEFLKEINQKVLSKYDTMTVGEMPFVRDEDEVLRVVGEDSKELNMIFIFVGNFALTEKTLANLYAFRRKLLTSTMSLVLVE